MRKLLITGSGGFLGWNLCSEAAAEYDLHGIYRSVPSGVEGVQETQLDLIDLKELEQFIIGLRPDAIIHTAAFSNNNALQSQPEAGKAINIDVSKRLAQLSRELNFQLVFTSTDLVFDGKKGMYTEEDDVNPISFYGEQKVQAEEAILSENPKACVCRMPLMLGATGTKNASFLQNFLERTAKGEAYPLFTDEYRTPIGARSAARALILAAGDKWSGVYHLGGTERMNRNEMGELFIRALDLENVKLKPCTHDDVKLAAPRQKNATLNSDKAKKLGFNPLSLEPEIKKWKNQIL